MSEVNARYERGQPSDTLADAGVLVHVYDVRARPEPQTRTTRHPCARFGSKSPCECGRPPHPLVLCACACDCACAKGIRGAATRMGDVPRGLPQPRRLLLGLPDQQKDAVAIPGGAGRRRLH
eukprot:5548052-Prymnesium_polylepis.1